MLKFITDRQLYEEIIIGGVPSARRFVWIATANIKDLHVDKGSRKVPFLEILSDLIEKSVEIRLLHAKEPGANFRRDFDRYPNLITGMERLLCSRVHFKSIIIDDTLAYIGSANLTGAGLGAKHPDRRNFEAGIITDSSSLIEPIKQQFDNVWRGAYCRRCRRKEFCSDYKDILVDSTVSE